MAQPTSRRTGGHRACVRTHVVQGDQEARCGPDRPGGGGSGGEINAWTSHDETVYHLVLASRFFDAGLDILADTIQNAGFDPVEFDRERHVVLEEIKQGLDDPERQAGQGLFEAAFDQHPYGRPIIGTEAPCAAFAGKTSWPSFPSTTWPAT